MNTNPQKPRSRPASSPPRSLPIATPKQEDLSYSQPTSKPPTNSVKNYIIWGFVAMCLLTLGIVLLSIMSSFRNKPETLEEKAIVAQKTIKLTPQPITQQPATSVIFSKDNLLLSKIHQQPARAESMRLVAIGGSTTLNVSADTSNKKGIAWEQAQGVDTIKFSPISDTEIMATFVNPGSYTFQDNSKKLATINVISPENIVFAINCGGKRYLAANAINYEADNHYSLGHTDNLKGNMIKSTHDDTLYNNARSAQESYSFDIPKGDYLVYLQFAETFFDTPRGRVFDVYIEEQLCLNDLDLVKVTGDKWTAVDYLFKTTVRDGTLDVRFGKVIQNPLLNGIVVVKD